MIGADMANAITTTVDASKAPSTPNEQAAALAGTAEKKIGAYKTFTGTRHPEAISDRDIRVQKKMGS
jgi:hypothetical protein